MAISRMQMNRQLYNLGSAMPSVNGREKFGLGSFIKKTIRKVIPNEVAEVASKAAPFVAPFNPLLAAGMAGVGSFDKSGSVSDALKRSILTYGGGQAARYIGGAGFQQGINPFAGADFSGGLMSGIQSLGSSPIGTQTGLKLGQYQMFGGTPTQEVVGVPEGTYLPTDFATEALPLEQATQQLTKTTTPGYTDLFKKVLSPQSTLGERTSAITELGGKALKDIYTNPVRNAQGQVVDTQIDKLAIGATIAGATSYLEAKKLAEEAELVDDADEYTEEMYNADKARYSDYYSQILKPEYFGLKDGGRIGYRNGSKSDDYDDYIQDKKDGIISLDTTFNEWLDDNAPEPDYDQSYKSGGRVKYAIGSPEPDSEMMRGDDRNIGIPSIKLDESTDQPEGIETLMEDKLSYYIPGFSSKDFSRLYRILGKESGKNVDFKNLHKVLSNPGDYPDAIIEIKQMLGIPETKKDGGRIGYAMGTEVPVRQNQGGVTELDYRNTGGFVPVGVKERADDVPAMLSKNEFVFTADAVRAAGGGSVNKGAQKMYNLMKSLENKVV